LSFEKYSSIIFCSSFNRALKALKKEVREKDDKDNDSAINIGYNKKSL